ncbi:hypothetical protein HHK36_009261 [Tetracentron sinense]|uniref:Pectinesterase inhibitor domain-containing protein n=1 Tax=Tetracentron sinense TaxID=13715 RepID=A0A834ZFY1_TETSI|nr:hypothetical protein HHK36_009261 [Tetracentron sinense]
MLLHLFSSVVVSLSSLVDLLTNPRDSVSSTSDSCHLSPDPSPLLCPTSTSEDAALVEPPAARRKMGSLAFLFLVLLPLSFPGFIHQSVLLVSGDVDLIQNTCKSTKYYDLCISSLKSDPTSLKADTRGLATIMVGIGMVNATGTYSYLSSQLLSTANDTLMKKVLKECADKYLFAKEAFQASLHELSSEHFDYAYMHVTAAADYPNACQHGFKRYPGLVYLSELARREEELKHLCDVALGIIDLLDW